MGQSAVGNVARRWARTWATVDRRDGSTGPGSGGGPRSNRAARTRDWPRTNRVQTRRRVRSLRGTVGVPDGGGQGPGDGPAEERPDGPGGQPEPADRPGHPDGDRPPAPRPAAAVAAEHPPPADDPAGAGVGVSEEGAVPVQGAESPAVRARGRLQPPGDTGPVVVVRVEPLLVGHARSSPRIPASLPGATRAGEERGPMFIRRRRPRDRPTGTARTIGTGGFPKSGGHSGRRVGREFGRSSPETATRVWEGTADCFPSIRPPRRPSTDPRTRATTPHPAHQQARSAVLRTGRRTATARAIEHAPKEDETKAAGAGHDRGQDRPCGTDRVGRPGRHSADRLPSVPRPAGVAVRERTRRPGRL